MPQGIHVANVPIDAAIGWTQEDGTRAHRLAGTTVDDNMADPDRIAETYLQLHRQHRSTWAFEVVLRPWAREVVGDTPLHHARSRLSPARSSISRDSGPRRGRMSFSAAKSRP